MSAKQMQYAVITLLLVLIAFTVWGVPSMPKKEDKGGDAADTSNSGGASGTDQGGSTTKGENPDAPESVQKMLQS